MANTSAEPLTITDDLIESTPIEKCSLNPRRGKNSRRLLTGFIIFASEARKEVADQYPNENFGFISRLVGDKWRALNDDIRFTYHKRALIHNKRIKDLAQKEGITLGAVDLLNGSHDLSAKVTKDGSNSTPKKLSKKKQAKLAKQERKRLANEAANLDRSSTSRMSSDFNNVSGSMTGAEPLMDQASQQARHQQNYHQPIHAPVRPSRRCTESGTQTPSVKYVEPPPKKPLVYSEAFLNRLFQLFNANQIVAHMDSTGAATTSMT